MKMKYTIALAGMLLILTGGCTTTGPRWPAITDAPTDVHIQGRWVWAELMADNVDTEKTFYRDVFGWQFESRGTGTNTYAIVRVEGRPIAGIIHFVKPAGAERAARWLPLMSVADVASAAEHAVALGGKVIVPAKSLTGRGETAVLADPEGALFGVIHSGTGDPPDEFPAYDTWFWMELWAKNAFQMADFYRPIGSYDVTRQEGPGDRTELHLMAGGFPRADILEVQRKDLPATWLPYVRVKDIRKTVDSVVRAGGQVVIEPNPEIRKGKVAVFLDPLGAAIAAVEWTDEGNEEGKP
jgi:predicted enzyme related to lactoylglutathione lyase